MNLIMSRSPAKWFRLSVPWVALVFFMPALTALRAQDKKKDLRQEESVDYYDKWLNEDVVYIITPQEREVFEKLTNPEEKERFIEQFWFRRDPDMTTPTNEYKEEHYRRLAYVNERFKSGVPGWRTDRGRIYIIHGPPAEIESHKMGQSYTRPTNEGGGQTVTYPFEIWRYRHIEGLGDDIQIEFVDPGGSGEFRIALTPWEKDALLNIPNSGLTIAEELGVATRRDHPYFSPGNYDTYFGMHTTRQDDPFIRYETLAKMQQAKPIKYKDLKELVDVNISYDQIPFQTRTDYFQLSERQVLGSISVELQNKDLSFASENGANVARVAIYGMVTSISNQVVTEFDDDVVASYSPSQLTAGLQSRSIYQKVLPLDRKLRYRLDLIIKDLASNKVGHKRIGLIPPGATPDKLTSSSVILSDSLQELDRIPEANEMFLLGNVKVRPVLNKTFSEEDPFWIYFQLYNAQLDQSNMTPSLKVSYRINHEGRKVAEFVDQSGETIQFFSGQRVVLISRFPIKGFTDGTYQLEIDVEDQLSGQSLSLRDTFKVSS
jgi:GWxTD domain-containing protein